MTKAKALEVIKSEMYCAEKMGKFMLAEALRTILEDYNVLDTIRKDIRNIENTENDNEDYQKGAKYMKKAILKTFGKYIGK